MRVFGPQYPGHWMQSVQTGGIVKTSGFTRGVCKNRGFIKFKGFLVEFLESGALLRKSKPPRKLPEKWIFLSLAFYNAPSLHTVDWKSKTISIPKRRSKKLDLTIKTSRSN